RQRLARRDRRAPLGAHGPASATAAGALRRRVVGRGLHGGRRAPHRRRPGRATRRGADGEETDVLLAREGGTRARTAADGGAGGAAGRRDVVRRPRLRAARARGTGVVSLTSLSARLTRRSRSNFYYAFLTLPRPRREALYAVYAFCRTVDD